MWLQSGRKMPSLNNQTPAPPIGFNTSKPSLQELTQETAKGEINALIDTQKYLKAIKKNAKIIDGSLDARIKMAQGSIITSAFARPLTPPNAHDRIKIKISTEDWHKYKDIFRSYVDIANKFYTPYGFEPIKIPSDEEIATRSDNDQQFTLIFDYLALSQIMHGILQDSHKAKTPQEQEFYQWATSNVVQAIKDCDKQKESTAKKIGYARTAFSMASAVASGAIFLGSYLGLFATPTLAILGMSFPIATIICVGLCTLPFIITMIKNVIGQIMDKTNDLDLELVKGTSKDLQIDGIQQSLEMINKTKQKAKQIEDNIATIGKATDIKQNIKQQQLSWGKMILKECETQHIRPEEMLEKCKNMDFVAKNKDNPVIALVNIAIRQGLSLDIHDAIVEAKLKEQKQIAFTKDLVDNVIHHSQRLNINPIDGARCINISPNTENYSERILLSIAQQAKNHNIVLAQEVQQRINGKNSGNILRNSSSNDYRNKLVSNNYYNNTMIGNNNNIANTGIPKSISNSQFLQ